jgi:hypothetical protein
MNTDKKNQHYIPKFYLRNFSFCGNNKQIGLFNVNSGFFHQTAALKTQGSKNFFYGQDGMVENELSDVEAKLAPVIREIIQKGEIPDKKTNSHIDLLTFVGLTDLRNPIMMNKIKVHSDFMEKHLLELHSKVGLNKTIPKILHSEVIKLALSMLEDAVLNMYDLDYKLLINNTNFPFICSDLPVVKYNRFLEDKKWQYGKTGYGCTGLKIFLPLNPKLAIVFFDAMVYKVGFKRRTSLEINNERDIHQLNTLQILNCLDTIFFNEKCSEIYIRDLFRKSHKYKRANKFTHKLFKKNNPIDINDQLVLMGSTDCEINLDLSGIKIHSGAKKIILDPSVAQLRPIPKKLRQQ